MKARYVGQPVTRREDPRLLQGLAHYVDDIRLPDTKHAAFVRSPHAHAILGSIDVAEARTMPGVAGVFTAADFANVGSVPCAAALEGLRIPPHPVLATGKVRYVGEPVVVVVADDPYLAADAIDRVNVEYQPLEAVVDPEAAAASSAVLVHDQYDDNIAFRWKLAGGDIEAAFAAADRIVTGRLVNQRVIPNALEGRGVLARYFRGEHELTVWTSTQIPHLARSVLAGMLGIGENRLRLITPEVGGGFGSKLNVYREEAIVAALAMRLGVPVKWIERRRENFQATTHGRGQVGEIELAVKKDGRVLGLRYKVTADLGAYHQLLTPAIPTLTGLMQTGPYKIAAVETTVTGVFTNKIATDAYRGAGRPEATYVCERAMDLVANDLKLDPVEVRRRNFPHASEFPFTTATGLLYDTGDYTKTLDAVLSIAGYEGLRDEQRTARTQGRHIGIGVSTYVEICALGPSAAAPPGVGWWESATVRVEPSGKVTVLTGASPHGQGQETSFAQLAADALGVDIDDVVVIHGDTAIVQYGIGTFGSRGTAVGGTAVYKALETLTAKALQFAAILLGVDAASITFADGRFTAGDKSATIQEVAGAAYAAKSLPPGAEPGLSATCFFEPKNFTFPFGAHLAVVEVDAETGAIKILRYVAVDDCGKVINPMLVEGQVRGGIAQGLGQALLEEAIYDESGQLVSGTFMDYTMPRASDMPVLELHRTETPTDVNPLGVKGVGEAGTIAATAAIVNAVVDALSIYGVRHLDMPLKAEKIWRAVHAAELAKV
jgi:aerobic carbon-monoxide dehydrogenase large subunit